MTEPELIEAMAVAIWNLEHGDGYNEWKRAPVDERDDYCELARAALDAIKVSGLKVIGQMDLLAIIETALRFIKVQDRLALIAALSGKALDAAWDAASPRWPGEGR